MYKTVSDIRRYFVEELIQERFTTDKTGAKTIEIIGASFIADEPAIIGEPNEEYINRELAWYQSQSTNINDIYSGERDAPAAWKYSANKYGEINSNYGLLVFGKKYNEQFINALVELIKNPDSRRASMIYNRPSIWNEYQENGKSDFICTNAVTYYIRDGVMECVVQMRSNDAWAGYRNDYAWQKFMLDRMVTYYNCSSETIDIEPVVAGKIVWQVQNLHIYSRNFYLVDHYIQTGEINISKENYTGKWK